MDAVKYLKIKARMNNKCKVPCHECILNVEDDTNCGCDKFEYENPELAVERMETWAKEHPLNTRQDKLLKLFPNARMREITNILDICPSTIDKTIICRGACAMCMKDYWLEEVEDEVL